MKRKIAASMFLLAACSSGEPPSMFSTSAPPPPSATTAADMSTGTSTSSGSTAGIESSGDTSGTTAPDSSGFAASSTSSGEGSSETTAAGDTSTSSADISTSTGFSDGSTSSSSGGEQTTGPAPVCGDGMLDAGEECDEAAENAPNAMCTPACLFAVCGDSYVFPAEEACDDGNALNTDACLNNCGVALCGDGFVQVGAEECDDANLVNNNACSDFCIAATCEDATKNGEETGVDCGGPTCQACSVPGLVLNEVDYDTPNDASDLAEFIELVNTTAAPIDLAGHAVMLVNGNGNTVYATIDLAPAGVIEAGQYLVIAAPAVAVPPTALKIAGKAGAVQNGSPDGIALVNTAKGVVLDALSYEGAMQAVTLPGFAQPVSLVEGLPCGSQDGNDAVGSLVRWPNGYDSNNAVIDWNFSATPTPGTANTM